jgi:signal transduction histidine kinase
MTTRRGWFVYGTLLAIWLLLVAWLVVEHIRFVRSEQDLLVDRARFISHTAVVVLRSQGVFGVIYKERLESALSELVKPGDLNPIAVEVLNVTNDVVASAGKPIELPRDLSGGVFWDTKAGTLILMNLVDFGTNIIMARGEPFSTNRPPPRRPDTDAPPPGPPPGEPMPPPPDAGSAATPGVTTTNPAIVINSSNNPAGGNGTNNPDARRGNRRRGRGDPDRPFEKPFWMKDEEYQSILQKKGVHGFVIVMSAQSTVPLIQQDFLLRGFIGLLGAVSVCGFGWAWRNLNKTSELQIRLVRVSELNSHLKEMNVAAAGLAHETRNPLNIVRGLAQMISRREDASPEIQARSREILEETDRVTAQLNEFINYSRPREVRRAAVNLCAVAGDVVRALNYDIEEKKLRVNNLAEPLTVEADEQLLRQTLFNLVLNATQAVPAGGEIWIRTGRTGGGEAYVEIADNGPGVAPEHRAEIFKPYFTTHSEGTGLGLAVVQQIVLAHGWEIECAANQPSGALFRITHLRLTGKS